MCEKPVILGRGGTICAAAADNAAATTRAEKQPGFHHKFLAIS